MIKKQKNHHKTKCKIQTCVNQISSNIDGYSPSDSNLNRRAKIKQQMNSMASYTSTEDSIEGAVVL